MKISNVLVNVGLITLLMAGCGKRDDDTDVAADETITLSGSLSLAGANLVADSSLSDLILYCTTFSSSPTAASTEFGSDGSFSLELPSGVPFGCFVNNKTSSATVGMFVFETGITSAMGGSTSASTALSGSVDLGALTLSEGGIITVPAVKLKDAVTATSESGIDLDLVHNTEYKLECIDAGNAAQYAACQEMISEGNSDMSVFLRILKGTESGKKLHGLGIWESKAAFDACGGFDMTKDEVSKIKLEEAIEFTSISDGAAFTVGTDCPLRNDSEEEASYNLKKLFAQSKLNETASGYSFYEDDEQNNGDGCYAYHSTGIDLTGTAAEMYGSFTTVEVRKNCGIEEDVDTKAIFNVKFTKK